MRKLFFMLASAVLISTVTPALAQTWSDEYDYVIVKRPKKKARAYLVEQKICEKMCMQDLSPCDPIEFKITDARCTNPMTSGGRMH